MKQWNFLQVSIHLKNLDKASGLLWDLGTQGIEEQYLNSSKVRIKAYFDSASNIRALTRKFKFQCEKASLPLHSISSRIEIERDWFKKWHKQFKPFVIGQRFHLIPSHRPAEPIPEGRVPIWLEPGMAFGTGTHETTQLCLETMEQYLVPKRAFLDIGTGSGILAIGATKLGAMPVVACDVDSLAIRIARANAAINRCVSKIEFVLGEVTEIGRSRFDLLVANLTLEIIEESLLHMEKRLRPGGWLVLSGILDRQFSQLKSRLEETSLILQERKKRNEWICLILRRKQGVWQG
jgi:ribosomal protein L11 methyltransferase